MPPRAVIFGLAGPELSDAERALFAAADPLGFILFARNIRHPQQVRRLVDDLRETAGRADAPVLIDQEGGRVARLGPPHWPVLPSPGRMAVLGRTAPEAAERAAWLHGRLLAADLAPLGIDVDCAPVLDIPQAGADPVIGDRAVGFDVASTIRLGRAWCRGLTSGGVSPVLKHLPGHGRARIDSHRALPVVNAPRAELETVDFAPFAALADAGWWAMTAHITYTSIDAAAPATLSATVVGEVIRGFIGFDGLLITDDLTMGALSGPVADRVLASLAAGCDVALHCNGDLGEMAAITAVCPPLTDASAARLARAKGGRLAPVPFDCHTSRNELDRLIAGDAVAGASES